MIIDETGRPPAAPEAAPQKATHNSAPACKGASSFRRAGPTKLAPKEQPALKMSARRTGRTMGSAFAALNRSMMGDAARVQDFREAIDRAALESAARDMEANEVASDPDQLKAMGF